MTREKAIKVLEMFLHKQCDLGRTEFSYDQLTIWDAVKMASDALEQEPILEKDGTLIVTTEHYENVGRVLVQYGTNGALFYQDREPITKNDLGVDWESYKDVDGNSLDDLILEVLQNNFDCGNTYGYKVADEIIGLLPSVTPQEPSWIPVAERLPQESRMFLVTLVDKEDDYVCIDVAWYAHPNDYSIEFGEWREVPTGEKVIAWMQLPEPYKGE